MIRQAAQEYAELGWHVVPVHSIKDDGRCTCKDPGCEKQGKHPTIRQWQKAGSTDAGQINKWWDRYPWANVGVVTGQQSNVVVIDADGTEGINTLSVQAIPAGPVAITGSGMHFYMRHPGRLVKNVVRLTALPGVDIRGERGLVVAPPSRHVSGAQYRWKVPPTDADPPTMPGWLIDAMTRGGSPAATATKVFKGGRNNALFIEACKLRGGGLEEPAIAAAIQVVNESVCDPPLPSAEVLELVASAAKYPPSSAKAKAKSIVTQATLERQLDAELEETLAPLSGADELRFAALSSNEQGNASRFAMLHGEDYRFCTTRGQWLGWVGSHWEVTTNGRIHRALMSIGLMAKQAALSADEPRDVKRMHRVSNSLASSAARRATMSTLEAFSLFETKVEDYDRSPDALAVMNGTVDLRDGRLYGSERSDMVSLRAGTMYDKTAKAPRWVKFLSEVFDGDEELIRYIQTAVGYSLTGHMNEQKLFILAGDGANGKSTMMRVIEALLGDYATNVGFDAFESKRGDASNHDLAGLRGVRFVSASEASDYKRLHVARIKRITGGEPLRTRFLYQEYFRYRPAYKIWFSVNAMPYIINPDFSVQRRLAVVKFNQRFVGDRDDKGLEGKLLQELPGVLNWALEGAVRWRAEGLHDPVVVIKAVDEYISEMDIIGQWLVELCDLTDPAAVTGTVVLYDDFMAWLKLRGHHQWSHQKFSREMRIRGFDKVKHNHRWCFTGIQVRDAMDLLQG